MIERFKDFILFATVGFLVTVLVLLLMGVWAHAMTFAERWVDLPPAVVLPQKHSLPEVPIYFCARYVSTSRCRIA